MAGLSKGMTLQDIADKHSIDIDVLKKEWKKGVKVEMEHTKDPKVAGRIAMDHLTEDPKYYTKLAKAKLEEGLNKDLVSEFMKHVMDELELKKLPKITLSDNSQEAIDLRSWGGYRPGDKSIHIVVAKRHPADIFRTLAHELVHYKQDLDGRLTPTSGETGSEDENEANSRAAVIMRNFAQAKPNLFEHLVKEGEYGDYLFGDKESGVKIGWYKDEVEVDTPAEEKLFDFLKKYADSEASTYSTINLDPYLETFKKIKTEYPEIGDPKLSPDTYIYRGTFISQEEAAKLYKNPNKEETKDTIIVPNQEYSSRRKVSSWSTRYYPAAAFAISTSERKNEGVPVVMRAKAGDAELFFNPRFMDKLSDQIEDEVINATNPIKVDIMLIKTYTDEFEDIESGYLSIKNESVKNTQQYLYHATYRPLLKKIKEKGLDTRDSKKAWDDSIPGYVYLAKDLDIAASYAESSDMVPDEWLDQIVVLTIDASKLDQDKMFDDANVKNETTDTVEYRGIIPWSTVIKVEKYK